MKPICSSDCLTALLFGLHYGKQFFSIADYFNEILDSIAEIPGFHLFDFQRHQIEFTVGNVNVLLNQKALTVNSPIVVGQQLKENIPRRQDAAGRDIIAVPIQIYDFVVNRKSPPTILEVESKIFKHNFLDETIEAVRLIDKIIPDGLPPLKFCGWVEYYAIPLSVIQWKILDQFTQEANIEGGQNTAKTAINRYYFPLETDGDEACLLFKLFKPDNHHDPDANVAGAFFDYQYLPKKNKTVEECGGVKEMIEQLVKGVEEKIQQSGFMVFNKG